LIKKGQINFQKEFMIPILKSNPWILKKLHGVLLSNMQKTTISGKSVVYSFATKEDAERQGWNPSDMRLGILCLQDIKDTDIVFTLTELEDNIKGSFRSRGIDTTLFSKEFGGGGHKEASSFYVENMPMGEAVNKVLGVIERIGIHKA
ncbi:MAG: DHHA1 domain-containing protein, partial [Nanoarchaeota archaeon]|nr:DHHA1 domain-containing protein [Nanoarchaeota archaeon]